MLGTSYKHIYEYNNEEPRGQAIFKDYDVYLKLCRVVAKAYATVDFEEMFSYMADDCEWTSYWTFNDRKGKDVLIDYFRDKQEAIESAGNFPEVALIELEGSITPPSPVYIDGKRMPEVRIAYRDGEPAIFQGQYANGGFNLVVITITVNKDGLLSGIHLMEPSFYNFRKIEDVTVAP